MNPSLVENHFIPKSILDIGANVGQFFKQASYKWPEADIFSIEANEECEIYLKGLTKNYKICLLAKDNNNYDYYKRLSHAEGATGNSIYKELTTFFSEGKYETKNLPGTTLDELVGNKTYDLIKLDTQGSELDIISGGLNVVNRCKALLIEVTLHTPYNENAPLYEDVVKFLENLNFEETEILATHSGLADQKDILFLNKNL